MEEVAYQLNSEEHVGVSWDRVKGARKSILTSQRPRGERKQGVFRELKILYTHGKNYKEERGVR